MTGIKLFFKYFKYYFIWYFTNGRKSDPYYYDNELYVDVEKEFKRDLRFRDVEGIIDVIGSLLFLFGIQSLGGQFDFLDSRRMQALFLVLAVLLVFVWMALMTIIVFSVWSTVLKVRELKSQS